MFICQLKRKNNSFLKCLFFLTGTLPLKAENLNIVKYHITGESGTDCQKLIPLFIHPLVIVGTGLRQTNTEVQSSP